MLTRTARTTSTSLFIKLSILCVLTDHITSGDKNGTTDEKKSHFVYPSRIVGSLLPCLPEDLVCPPTVKDYATVGLTPTKKKLLMPAGGKTEHVGGVLCHLVKKRTTCWTSLWGSNDISQQEYRTPVVLDRCRLAVNNYLRGEHENVEFPESECSWMSTIDMDITGAIITPHETFFDPYKTSVYDKHLIRSCRNRVCETVRRDLVWFALEEFPLPSDLFQKQDCIIYSSDPDNEATLIKCEGYPYLTISNQSCQINYGGRTGVATPHHFAIFGNIPGHDSLPPCSDNVIIGVTGPMEKSIERRGEYADMNLRERCLDAIDRITNENTVTLRTLGHFMPRSPGRHPVYILINSTLMCGSAKYKEYTGSLDNDNLWTLLKNSLWVHWADDNHLSYNGVLRYGKESQPEIHIPHLNDIRDSLVALHTEELELIPTNRVVFIPDKEVPLNASIPTQRKTTKIGGDLGTSFNAIGSWFQTNMSLLITLGTGMALLGLGYVLLMIVLKCIKGLKKPPKSDSINLNLQPFQPSGKDRAEH
ncbi:glycoprotein [Lepeophtheirus salmonis rhabdovirus 9]|uniref:Glycoprotein n=1 Tax=Lepeophtheirus salmonis rhabdovirus 9 TaxID=1573760 RepID=A0A0A1E7E7_9RHAB|nr:glycoprotein [Lepeophtheirus salmonis rhabdovirus 9]AIY25910.1 glycoprotein [Lepeophtheirus salmonis rhabdovirus 9]